MLDCMEDFYNEVRKGMFTCKGWIYVRMDGMVEHTHYGKTEPMREIDAPKDIHSPSVSDYR